MPDRWHVIRVDVNRMKDDGVADIDKLPISGQLAVETRAASLGERARPQPEMKVDHVVVIRP